MRLGRCLITLLAYAGDSEATRGHVHASLCTHALRVKSEIEPDWATAPQLIKPIYALRYQRDLNRDLPV
jgi:hypothetical protein